MAKQSRSVPTTGRLGRGLSSLIDSTAPRQAAQAAPADRLSPDAAAPSAAAPPRAESPAMLPIDRIDPNPHQPRRNFDPDELASLAASIRTQGILQPLLVTPSRDPVADGRYMLIAGERRLRAARQAGLSRVPCIVKEATERQLIEWSLIENIQREDLNPIERAEAYRSYMDRFSLTQAQVAERTGQSRANVANYLRLLDLSDDIQQMLLAGTLTFGHARALASLAGSPDRQLALARRILADGLSVRRTEQLVARAASGAGPAEPAAPKARPAYLVDLERRLTEAVGTRVQILPGRRRSRGKIVVEYYSLDDFDRIAGLLGLRPEQ